MSDECGIYQNSVKFSCTSTDKACSGAKNAGLGIIAHSGPAHKNYVTEQARLSTYSTWPPALPQRPQELAQAGFFYTGLSDQVKCFYCDGGLESWEKQDDPWSEHQKWFSDCTFVKMMRSSEDKSTRTIQQDGGKQPTITNIKHKPKQNKKVKPVEQTTAMNMEELQKEIEILKEARNCKICMEKEASIVFLPCGHLVSCTHCAPSLQNCAVCRGRIQGLIRTFMP